MLSLRPEEIFHKSQINRLLMEIIDLPELAQALAFKGGSCAAMLGYLDRFSVDLDFDVIANPGQSSLRRWFHQVFDRLGLTLSLEYKQTLTFQLRYTGSPGKRTILKVSASDLLSKANQYRVQYFPEIDRLINSQTIETMFANKLVAITDRFDQHASIAGRDLYDVHHFFTQGHGYIGEVIRERTGLPPHQYLRRLVDFIKEHFTQTVINEDLNSLLPPDQFQRVRKILLPETIALLEHEIARSGSND